MVPLLLQLNSIKIFDFSILFTTIPHSKLQVILKEWVQLCFIKKNSQHRYIYLVLGRSKSYFVKTTLILLMGLWNWYHQNAWVFGWQHIFIFGGLVFQQRVRVCIPMGTNYAPLLADLFMTSQGKRKNLVRSFNCMYM